MLFKGVTERAMNDGGWGNRIAHVFCRERFKTKARKAKDVEIVSIFVFRTHVSILHFHRQPTVFAKTFFQPFPRGKKKVVPRTEFE